MEADMDWQRLARANTHPLRISVLEVLALDGGRTLSPSDLSYELRVPLSNVNYHVTELVKSQLIELARQRQVRGATEHFYRLTERSNGAGPNGANGASSNGHAIEERTTGLEPATSSLGSSRSTN
jgi:predicted ArsR family transcriptional regulator